jgi:hypothetical protein
MNDRGFLTAKQTEIVTVVVTGNGERDTPAWEPCDVDQICERLSYRPSKEALVFSLRFLIKRGFIEKGDRELRRGARRRVILPQQRAVDFVLRRPVDTAWVRAADPVLDQGLS